MATTAVHPAPRTSPLARRDYSSSLHWRFLMGAAAGGIVTVALLAGSAWSMLRRTVTERENATLREAAHRSALVLGTALEERRRETEVLAHMPNVIDAARLGGETSVALGLVGVPIDTLEKRYAAEHSLRLAPATRLTLRDLLPRLDAHDALLTDRYGYNALITDRSADFVQSDEGWWQDAWRDGRSISDAVFDSASRRSIVALSSVIGSGATKLGVLKVKFNVTPLVASLASAGAGVRVDVLDSAGRVLLSSDTTVMGSLLTGLTEDSLVGRPLRVRGVAEHAVTRDANGVRWRIVAHMPDASVAAAFVSARRAIQGGALALLLVLALLLCAMHRFLTRRITAPVGALALAAEAVAAGDFSVQVRHVSADDEIGRTSRAVGAMVGELRRLAHAIATSTRETTIMSSEITAGSEEMAATAGEIADTASDLSVQSTSMAESIASLAGSAGSLSALASELETGAAEGVSRNAALRTLATENRAGLDASSRSLGVLGEDVHASARAIDALAEASDEIRSFVALVRKLARQSKLLALNAAMEAARAGEQGAGFAVVASEVRRLAAMSSEAAERTEGIVNGVLHGIQESRASSGRAAAMADEVRAANLRASASFAQIESAVEDADAWTTAVQRTATGARELVGDMTRRLDALAGGTESFAAAMEQVAASSEEQSAATQEIAGAAGSLAAAADRLSHLVSNLRLGDDPDAAPAPAQAPSEAVGMAGTGQRGEGPRPASTGPALELSVA